MIQFLIKCLKHFFISNLFILYRLFSSKRNGNVKIRYPWGFYWQYRNFCAPQLIKKCIKYDSRLGNSARTGSFPTADDVRPAEDKWRESWFLTQDSFLRLSLSIFQTTPDFRTAFRKALHKIDRWFQPATCSKRTSCNLQPATSTWVSFSTGELGNMTKYKIRGSKGSEMC